MRCKDDSLPTHGSCQSIYAPLYCLYDDDDLLMWMQEGCSHLAFVSNDPIMAMEALRQGKELTGDAAPIGKYYLYSINKTERVVGYSSVSYVPFLERFRRGWIRTSFVPSLLLSLHQS